MCWNKKDIKFTICFHLRSIEQTTTCGRQSKFLRPYQKQSRSAFCNQPTSRQLLPLATTTTGNYYHWQLLPLATTTTGNYYDWQLLLRTVLAIWGSAGGGRACVGFPGWTGGRRDLPHTPLPNYWHFHSASRLSFWFMSRGMLYMDFSALVTS